MAARPVRRPRDEGHLASLLSDVSRARTAFRDVRGDQADHLQRVEQHQRASDLVEAMRAYADAATAAGVPLPYRYRDELRLYESMCEHGRYRPR